MRIEKVFVGVIALAFGLMSTASAEPVRIAMPSKSMTFLNFYLADKFGLFKNEGLEVSFRSAKRTCNWPRRLAASARSVLRVRVWRWRPPVRNARYEPPVG